MSADVMRVQDGVHRSVFCESSGRLVEYIYEDVRTLLDVFKRGRRISCILPPLPSPLLTLLPSSPVPVHPDAPIARLVYSPAGRSGCSSLLSSHTPSHSRDKPRHVCL